MLLRSLVSLGLLLSGGLPVSAMTFYCGAIEPLTLYREAHASSDRFVVLLGRVGLEEDLEIQDLQNEPFSAPFQGFSLTPEGFTEPVSTSLRIAQFCDPDLMGICGDLRVDKEALIFARVAEDGSLSVTVGPCGRWAQHDVDPSDLEELAVCAWDGCRTTP